MKMPKINLGNMWRIGRQFERAHRPQILAGMGVAGFWGSMWLTYKASPKIHETISVAKLALHDEDVDSAEKKVVKKEMIIDVAKDATPPVLMGIISSAAMIGSTSVSTKRIAAISAAYSATEAALSDYRGKVQTLLGDDKDRRVREGLARDAVQTTPVNEVEETGLGNVLCLDRWTGRYFHSSPEAVKRAFNEISRQVQLDEYASLNDLYDRLNLRNAQFGDVMGWTSQDNWRGVIDAYFTTTTDSNSYPVLVVDYDIEVLPGYLGKHGRIVRD